MSHKTLWNVCLVLLGIMIIGSFGHMAFAGEPFTLIISSDPQLGWGDDDDTRAASDDQVQAMHDILNTNDGEWPSVPALTQGAGSPIQEPLAVIINGDLTNHGHDTYLGFGLPELSDFKEDHEDNLDFPIIPGLGNHDYANNVNDCGTWPRLNNCARRMIDYMKDWITDNSPTIKECDGCRLIRSDYISDWDTEQGSLAYSWEIGDYHFVQLQNYPTYATTIESGFGYVDREITKSLAWLAADLTGATASGKKIVFNLHTYGTGTYGEYFPENCPKLRIYSLTDWSFTQLSSSSSPTIPPGVINDLEPLRNATFHGEKSFLKTVKALLLEKGYPESDYDLYKWKLANVAEKTDTQEQFTCERETEQWNDLLRRHNVVAVFSGHIHQHGNIPASVGHVSDVTIHNGSGTVLKTIPHFRSGGVMSTTPGGGPYPALNKFLLVEFGDTYMNVGTIDARSGTPAFYSANDDHYLKTYTYPSLPTLTIADAEAAEDAGLLKVPVTLSQSYWKPVTVKYSIMGIDAGPNDYDDTGGTLTIEPGETRGDIIIKIYNDDDVEDDETFLLTLSNPVNATFADAQATGTIIDNDFPTLTILPAIAHENTGKIEFPVKLSAYYYAKEVSFTYTTTNGTAVAPSDYTAATQHEVTIPPLKYDNKITISLANDSVVEGMETFSVKLSNPSNATISVGEAIGTIIDDDVPSLTIADAEAAEDTGLLKFPVTLSQAHWKEVSVQFILTADTADPDRDYGDETYTLKFNPGETSKELIVKIYDDDDIEGDETFMVILQSPTNATIADDKAIGTILDDDALPELTIDDVSADEDAGTMTFTVRLSRAYKEEVRVTYTTQDGTASAGSDYGTNTGTLTILAGATEGMIPVVLRDDSLYEDTERFYVTLSGSMNATIADGEAVGTILDDDSGGPPTPDPTEVPIPEPSTLVLLILGLLGIGWLARRRRR